MQPKDATTPEQPRTAAAVTRDWLSGAMLVGMGSVEQGKYEGRAAYEAAADEAIRWLTDNGMSLAIEAQARPAVASKWEDVAAAKHVRDSLASDTGRSVAALDVERLARALMPALRNFHAQYDGWSDDEALADVLAYAAPNVAAAYDAERQGES